MHSGTRERGRGEIGQQKCLMASRKAKAPIIRARGASIQRGKGYFTPSKPIAGPQLHPILPMPTLRPKRSPSRSPPPHCKGFRGSRRPQLSLDCGSDARDKASPGLLLSERAMNLPADLDETLHPPIIKGEIASDSAATAVDFRGENKPKTFIRIQPGLHRVPYHQLSIIGLNPIDTHPQVSLLSRYRDRPRPFMGAGGFTVHRRPSLPPPAYIPPCPFRPQTQLNSPPRPKLLVVEARIPRPASSAQ